MVTPTMRSAGKVVPTGSGTPAVRLGHGAAAAAGFRAGSRVIVLARPGVVVVLPSDGREDDLAEALERLAVEVRAGTDWVCPACRRFHVASPCGPSEERP